MDCHISFRDISFHPSTKGVRIIVTTDVPCHLYCRLTSEKPHIHKIPVFRRGHFIQDDIRICFTVYEDNEQYESGDTLTHTFWKENWPVCTTKWSYYWGTINGQVCVSTSPIFDYHNTGIDPVPTPRVLKTFETIEPEFISGLINNNWCTKDLSAHVDEDATGAIFQLVNHDAGVDRYVGLRKTGTLHANYAEMNKQSMTWACCGLDDNKQIDIFVESQAAQDFWLMGYTSSKVQFLDTPIDIAPSAINVYEDFNVHAYYPQAKAVILDIGAFGGGFHMYSVRKKGSTDDRFWFYKHNWPIIGLDSNGIFQRKFRQIDALHTNAKLVGYFTDGATMETNGVIIAGIPAGFWRTSRMDVLTANPIWAIVEMHQTVGSRDWGVQKGGSLRQITQKMYYKEWAYPHLTPSFLAGFYKQDATVNWYNMGEITP